MNPSKNQTNEIAEAFADVAVRFREHEQYGSKQLALKALKRRCPGLPSTECESAFDFYLTLLDATIQVLAEYVKSPQFSPHGHMAGPSDIDYQAIVAMLRLRVPGDTPAPLDTFINWVLFWHYLK